MQNRLEALQIFCAAAEESSFKQVAIRLAISPQKVTRAIKELERLRGEQLFHRNTRQIKITQFGADFAEQAKQVISQFEQLFPDKHKMREDIRGIVRITAPNTFGREVVMPALTELAVLYPAITLEFHLANTHSNLVDEEIDIGVRIGFLHDQTCVVRQPKMMPFYLVAAPSLLARTGLPKSIEELSSLPIIALINRKTGRYWPWEFSNKRRFHPEQAAFITDDPDIERNAALAGIGFGHMAGYLVEKYLASGQLISVLPNDAPEPWPLNLYRPYQEPVPARIRLVFDYLYEKLSQPAYGLDDAG
ncbi:MULTISPECIES: LysR family transcriptional regulator [Serratia]|uniref:Transcriptional regulator, LysR family n=1 Tax=Serratia proteamaculans (strain 568) TaxID=399741 RepID=A8GIM0_SERP5|nr:LysR family transcriptional regulator [Serratia quinivorans]CAI1632736.1 D-malate degradation protein R [Serratia quinivorans]